MTEHQVLLQFFDDLAAKLRASNLTVFTEGCGGLTFLTIESTDGRMWVFGDANETWCADLYPTPEAFSDGTPSEDGVDTEISTDSRDVEAIAKAFITKAGLPWIM